MFYCSIIIFRLQGLEAWIGLTRENDNCYDLSDLSCRRRDAWSWSDATLYDPDVFHKWNSREPSAIELCARIRDGEWFGMDCQREYRCICEKG